MVEALQIKHSSLLLYEIEPNGRVVLSAKSATFEELADTFPKKRPRNPVSDEQQFATFAEAPNGVAKLCELILQLAVQGKLCTHDVNDEPASEIVRRIDAARGLKRPAHDMRPDTEGLPRGWKLVRMGQIADHRLGKMLDKAKNKGELFPYLRNTNVQWWRFALDDLKEMRFVADELTEYEVRQSGNSSSKVPIYTITLYDWP